MINKNKNLDVLLKTLFAFFLCFICFSQSVYNPLFILAGISFIMVSFRYEKKYVLLMAIMFFLLTSLFLNEIYAAVSLLLLSPFFVAGILMKKFPKSNLAFFASFSLLSLFITGIMYYLNYYNIFSLDNAISNSIKNFYEVANANNLNTYNVTEIEVINFIKRNIPSGIIITSILSTLINISTANRIMSKGMKKEVYLPFKEFQLPVGFFIPMLLFLFVFLFDNEKTFFLKLIFNNLAVTIQTLVALQGLSVLLFLSRNIRGLLKILINSLAIIGFIYGSFIFSLFGFFDIMFNLRKLPKRS